MRNQHSARALSGTGEGILQQPGQFGVTEVDESATTAIGGTQGVDDVAEGKQGAVDGGALFEALALVLWELNIFNCFIIYI